MPVKMSKDGQTFFDVDDSPDSQQAAEAKGYKPFMDVTKDGNKKYTIEATPDSIKAATDKGYVSTQAYQHRQAMPATKQAPQSALEVAGRGVADYGSLGFGDELTGAVGAIKDLGNGKSLGDNYAANRDYARQQNEQAQQQNPALYHGAGLAASIANPLQAVNGIGGAVAQGAIAGLGNGQGTVTDQLMSAGIGAGVGAIGGAIGAKLSPEGLTATADKATLKAVGAMKGDLKQLGPQGASEFAQGVRNNGILGAGTDAMLENAQAAKQAAGQQMGKVFDTIDEAGASTFNPLKVANEFDQAHAPTFRSPINRDVTQTFDNVLETVAQLGSQDIPLRTAQELKQTIGNVAYPGGKAALNPTDKQQMAMDAYRAVSKAIDDAAGQGAQTIGTDGLKESLQAAKSSYGVASKAEKMLNAKLAGENSRKAFGLTDTIVAAAHSNPVTAVASLAVKKTAEKFGPAAIAGSADWAANALTNNPHSLGAFAGVIKGAMDRGPAALAATHYLLQQTNPQYRAQVEGSNAQDPQVP